MDDVMIETRPIPPGTPPATAELTSEQAALRAEYRSHLLVATESFLYREENPEDEDVMVIAGITRVSDQHPMLEDADVAAMFAPLDSPEGLRAVFQVKELA